MDSTHQHIYATNLRQNFGYPLRNPKPNSRLGQPYVNEGLQIGDVGYVDEYGEFIWLFNVKFPPPDKEKLPEEFRDRNLDPPDKLVQFAEPVAKQALELETVFMTGVVSNVTEPRATYEFTATSKAGAILILPDGAILSKLEDKQKLEEFRQHATNHALQWCRYAQRDSLYLVTAAYKTKTWTLGSFYDGSAGKDILVHRQSRNGTAVYIWKYQFNVDHQQCPGNNYDLNQTVFIKGFKITVRWDWFRVIESVERPQSGYLEQASYITTKLIWHAEYELITEVECFPTRNLSQPLHPLDVINRVLLEQIPSAQVVVTHDNTWIEMLEKGLSHTDLMKKDRLRAFIENEYGWDLDSQHAVYLRSKSESVDQPEPDDPLPLSLPGDTSRLAITNIRLENIDVDHIHAGVCILIQFGSETKRTENKPHASIIEWDDVVTLPSELPISVTICGAFQLGSILGTRKINQHSGFAGRGSSFLVGNAESCSSLLITLVRHFSQFETVSNHDEYSVFVQKTNLGFEALYSNNNKPKEEHLIDAIEYFQCALEQCGPDSACRPIALFNLATSKFIWCQAKGSYIELDKPIELYREALKSRNSGDPDRPVTLLLLAQALLLHRRWESDDSVIRQIEDLLVAVHTNGGRDHQTADAVMRTCRFYQTINSGNAAEIDKILRDLDRRAYAPPYGFFDWPHMLYKLGVALSARFQLSMDLSDLEKSIALNKEALHLIPNGHHDYANIVTCLGTSTLRLVEVCGGLTDTDVSGSLKQLGEMVIKELDDLSSVGVAGALSWQKFRDQIRLMSAANSTFNHSIQIGPSRQAFEIRSLIDEWKRTDGTPATCKRQLGVLLSFLRGEGEAKMRELMEGVEWPFKEHKVEETTQMLQGHMPYFQSVVATTLKWGDEFDYTAKHLHQQQDIMRDRLFKEEVYSKLHGSKKFLWPL